MFDATVLSERRFCFLSRKADLTNVIVSARDKIARVIDGEEWVYRHSGQCEPFPH